MPEIIIDNSSQESGLRISLQKEQGRVLAPQVLYCCLGKKKKGKKSKLFDWLVHSIALSALPHQIHSDSLMI
ncbi:Uncharacterized protein DAT39_003131 [Clarias magur]|uniref:Uncharacterized protein n=1 Tax=Clarias magur TaxID=1594786 RepID=A0A8J4X9Q5_CLAMG|nr:Uncharacterized protein DAT39_003131 [Clarias magur]